MELERWDRFRTIFIRTFSVAPRKVHLHFKEIVTKAETKNNDENLTQCSNFRHSAWQIQILALNLWLMGASLPTTKGLSLEEAWVFSSVNIKDQY